MIAKGYIIIAAAIHDFCKLAGLSNGIVTKRTQWRTLENISSVDEQCIAVFVELIYALKEPYIAFLGATIICRENIAMRVRGKIDFQSFLFHTYPLVSFVRILAEIHSIIITRTIKPSRIDPTSFQR